MNRHISFGALVVGLSISACGSSSTATTTASATGSGAGSTTGGTGKTTGNATGGSPTASGGSPTASGGSPTASGGGSTTGAAGGSSTGSGLSGMVSDFAGNPPVSGSCGAFGGDPAFSPQFLAIDSTPNLYVMDDALDKITVPGATLNVLVSTFGTSVANGMAVTAAGVAYYSEQTAFGEDTDIFMGSTAIFMGQPPSCNDTGSAAGAVGLGQAAGIAVDAQGNVYVADEGCYRVRKVSPAGVVSAFSGTGVPGYMDGAGDVAQFSTLAGITIDPNGNLFVYESDTHHIREIAPDGTTSTIVSSANDIGGMAVDANETIWFSDFQTNNISKIVNQITSLVAGNTSPGHRNGAAAQAEFNSPAGVVVDANGNVYVADSANCVIREITTP